MSSVAEGTAIIQYNMSLTITSVRGRLGPTSVAHTVVEDDQQTRIRSERPAAALRVENGRRACGEHFRVPTGTLHADVLCQASRSSLNGRMRSNA